MLEQCKTLILRLLVPHSVATCTSSAISASKELCLDQGDGFQASVGHLRAWRWTASAFTFVPHTFDFSRRALHVCPTARVGNLRHQPEHVTPCSLQVKSVSNDFGVHALP